MRDCNQTGFRPIITIIVNFSFLTNFFIRLYKMSSDDEFFTIESKAQAEIKIKGSRFIGTAVPVQSVEDAKKFINELTKKYYSATHNCYAFRIRSSTQIFAKSSDAGEPSGTAGPSILNVLTGRNLFNILVVVTRYFGGTKLGKGGLTRAYGDCTKRVLDLCVIIKKYNLVSLTIFFPYNLVGNVMHVISQFNGKIVSSVYDQQVELAIKIPQSLVDEFKNRLVEITSGKVNFK